MSEATTFDVWGVRTPPSWALRALEKGIIDANRFEALIRVAGEAGERVGRGGGPRSDHAVPFADGAGVHGPDRTERRTARQPVPGVVGLVDRRAHEPAGARVALPAGDEREVRVGARPAHHLLVLA